jgi:hypothetical protein
MAILCWAAKNSLRGTLPRCTAGVAEPVLCSSGCRFLTSCWKLSLPRLREGWLLQLLPGWDHHLLASTPRRGAPGCLPAADGFSAFPLPLAGEFSSSPPFPAGRFFAFPPSPAGGLFAFPASFPAFPLSFSGPFPPPAGSAVGFARLLTRLVPQARPCV